MIFSTAGGVCSNLLVPICVSATLAEQLRADGQLLRWPLPTTATEADAFDQTEEITPASAAVPVAIRQKIRDR